MKSRFALIAITAIAAISAVGFGPSVAASSPGGLDSRGGHHCWTNCSARGYYTGQYHCHRSPCGKADVRRHRRHGH
jgi:hypothetical protein